jgi:hypothetical protein
MLDDDVIDGLPKFIEGQAKPQGELTFDFPGSAACGEWAAREPEGHFFRVAHDPVAVDCVIGKPLGAEAEHGAICHRWSLWVVHFRRSGESRLIVSLPMNQSPVTAASPSLSQVGRCRRAEAAWISPWQVSRSVKGWGPTLEQNFCRRVAQ